MIKLGLREIVALSLLGFLAGFAPLHVAADSKDAKNVKDVRVARSLKDLKDCRAITLPSLKVSPIAFQDDEKKKPFRFRQPVAVLQAPGTNDMLWVVEREGIIRLVKNQHVLEQPFLDIHERVWIPPLKYSENGLLSVAFHPDYAKNGRFFVFYTAHPLRGRRDLNNTTVVSEYRRDSKNPLLAERDGKRLFVLEDHEGNHNGGMLLFGPKDGFLYLTIGDEGGRCDKYKNAQNLRRYFGKLLRFDAGTAGSLKAAPGNPVWGSGNIASIWAYGLRNVWRMSFDRKTGDLYLPDVGQDVYEEINIQPAASGGGENYGWSAYEGFESAKVSGCASTPLNKASAHVPPVAVYTHSPSAKQELSGGKSITGGYVYRGKSIPALDGVYLFGDFVTNDVGALRYQGKKACDVKKVPALSRLPGMKGLASFGEDNAGELYLVFVVTGHIVRLVPK